MKGRNDRAAVAHTPQDPSSDLPTPENANTPQPAYALPLQSPQLLTKREAAAYCGVTPVTFDDYRRRGIVPNTTPQWVEQVTRYDGCARIEQCV